MNYFAVNRELLIHRFPGMEKELFSPFSPSAKLTAVPSKEGPPAALIGGKAICSRHDPVQEGEKLVEREIPPAAGCCIFSGFGLGYTVAPYLARDPDNIAIVVEKDPSLFLKALELRDFTALFDSDRIWFLLGSPAEAVAGCLKKAGTRKIALLTARYIREQEPDWCRELEHQVDQFVNRRNVNINTLKKFGRRWILNLGANLCRYRQAVDLDKLKGLFGGIPCLLLAAGPSLELVLPHLPELRERFLLVSVDTALRSLLKRGVVPDLTVVVDPQYWNYRHLDRCRAEGCLLVTDSSAFPDVFTRFSAPWIFYRSPFPLAGYLEKSFGFKGRLHGGGSVATAAWEISRLLGCAGVWAAGLDLGFPGGHTHFKGSFFEELRHVISGRIRTEEILQWHALRDASPHFVEDSSGGQVLTDQRMWIYRLWFEEQAVRHPGFVTVNLSPGGVRIKGHKPGKVEELLSRPVIRQRIDHIMGGIRNLPPGGLFEQTCRGQINSIKSHLIEIALLAREGESLTSELVSDIPGGRFDTGKLAALDRIDRALIEAPGKEIVSFILQPLIYRISWGEKSPSGPSEILGESGEIYRSIRESAEFHVKILENSEKKLNEIS
jgi:hypothetical protein